MVQNRRADEIADNLSTGQADSAVAQISGKPGRRQRAFDYGELRLLLLAMIAKQSSHGYELIHEIKERLGGTYKPSPGVIYPALTWLYDRGYTEIDLEKGGRKRYSITNEGQAFLSANKNVTDMLLARVAPKAHGPSPQAIVEAMDHLKRALSLRIKMEPVAAEVITRMGDIIHVAANQIEALLNAPVLSEGAVKCVANIATPNGERFLRRLCTHFQHRTPVVTDENSGHFRMNMGEVRMEALEGVFRVSLTALTAEKLDEMQHILVRHLEETAVREKLDVIWQSV
ncbi:PadR family transcriptional regulator [Mixta theicola]|uniref:PadR family transcriptional regulator n=1 Tax=Mixta theicola TaxID=1458355 RepID=A0A2K1QEM4_9GAMM|nr:DUF2218 domain-containing protein [Mixta theicola]PNS13477.1 PadR family transcriptional regulator [Mixta theicola]GLR09793.1 hypothetical protein GCM10007905_25130 [Mixta theicola]